MAIDKNDDDLILDIPESDVAGKAEPAKSSEDEGVAALKARVEEAKKAREADRLAREESERRAASASEEANRLRRDMASVRAEASSDRLNMVVAAIDSVQREAEMATAAFEAAATTGDYKALAKAQREISRAEARLMQLEASKDAVSAEISAAKGRAEQPQRAESNNSDPADRYIASLTPRSAVWMAQHRDLLASNGAPKQELIAAHNLALAKGHQADSDGYFSYIERKLTEFRNEDAETGTAEPDNGNIVVDLAPKRSAAPSAPVSRSAPGDRNNGTRVTLNREQLEAAEIAGMTPSEYAESLRSPETKARLARYIR